MKEYYERRAPEYDDWYLTRGLFEARERPGWKEELAELVEHVSSLPPARVLDVACGTGFLTRHLRGELVGLDQSGAMLGMARKAVPGLPLVRADALALPFPDRAFDRVFTSHFYGHLPDDDRRRFLSEARSVAAELVIVDAGVRGGVPRDEWQDRVLSDGSRHRVFKRFFESAGLAAELGGGETLHDGRWFVAVRCCAAAGRQARTHGQGWGD